ncbi:methyltransferase domain-containing protein, partial [Nocardiopsis gilva]|uniref:methyltransferase domain-containing protein n=1 Tax=Nocardiopsis gilva TaxID=280236 RepID=UPI0003742D11
MTRGQKAVAAVDRTPFVPADIWVPTEETGWLVPLNRYREPDRWRRCVDADEPIVTAVEFDPRIPQHLRNPETGRGVVATSSSSKPGVMAAMLDALEPDEDMRALEIGTGTGYNAAVISHITGPGTVTSVEVAPGVADAARAALDATGFEVEVVTGDGNDGYPPGAPYDRVIVTAAVRHIPYAWVEQCSPGAVIVAPWAPVFHPDSPLAIVHVGEDGHAAGTFTGSAPFMPLDGEATTPAEADAVHAKWKEMGRPDPERFGITIAPQGQRVWLGTP